MGKILAYAGLTSQKEVSWMPAYGPEQRGGTANVTVIISDDRISSPVLNIYDSAILLNQQSLTKFEPKIRPGGLVIYDPQLIHQGPTRKDIRVFSVKAMEAASELNNLKAFNMIVLGAYIKQNPIVSLEAVIEGLKHSLPERHHHLLPINEAALIKGGEMVEAVNQL